MGEGLWGLESSLLEEGFSIVCGIDEAGRGPLAGAVYAAAVVLPFGVNIEGLDDSKRLSETVRERLYDEIVEKAITYGIGSADHLEIDSKNILNATYLAMNRAYDMLSVIPDIALVDGNRGKGFRFRHMCVVGGDGKSASIAAASILAKVSRDREMLVMAEKYPEYGFEKHKGYGTKQHIEKLLVYGPCEIHRRTFLGKILMHSAECKGIGNRE